MAIVVITQGTAQSFRTNINANFATLDASVSSLNASVTVLSNGKADKDSPAFTGVPTAPTAVAGTNTTQLATTAFVQASIGTAGGHYVGTTAPDNTRLLWIDTTASTGGLKYYNGTTWVVVPVSYS